VCDLHGSYNEQRFLCVLHGSYNTQRLLCVLHGSYNTQRFFPVLYQLIALKARWQNYGNRLLAASCLPLCPFVRMEQLGSHWTDFHEIWYLRVFFSGNLSRKSIFDSNLTRVTDRPTWREYLCHSVVISHRILLGLRNIVDKYCTGNQNTHFVFNILYSNKIRL
jgi:hypothetical protein